MTMNMQRIVQCVLGMSTVNMEKRFQLKVKCDRCNHSWDTNTNMKYYVTCPDCKRPVDIRAMTGVKRVDFS